MPTSVEKNIHALTVETTGDRMRAWIRLADAGDPQPLTQERILQALQDAEIVVDDAVRGRVTEYIAAGTEADSPPEQFTLAEGRPPVEAKDGDLLWHESVEKQRRDWQGDSPVDYFGFSSTIMVEKDQPIGTRVPAVPGADGVDVFGKTVTPARCAKDVELDTTVRPSDADSMAVVANCAGKIVYDNGRLSISEVFEIKKSVDSESGNIDSPVDVHIDGTILDRSCVKSQKSISVAGAIETATVEAERDVIVRGGIIQRDEGLVSAHGDITAKFCEGARLRAEGHINITGGVVDSLIHCRQKLRVGQGAVVGGQAYARGGVEAATLGSGAGVPTEIILGIDPDVLHEVAQLREGLKSKRQAIEQIRAAVQPLMADLKRLTAPQRERATELMFQADQAEAEVTEAEDKHAGMLAAARAKETPCVLVSKAIHRGVTVRIGHRKTTFEMDVQGPIVIEKRKVDSTTEFVAIDRQSDAVTILPSKRIANGESAKAGATA